MRLTPCSHDGNVWCGSELVLPPTADAGKPDGSAARVTAASTRGVHHVTGGRNAREHRGTRRPLERRAVRPDGGPAAHLRTSCQRAKSRQVDTRLRLPGDDLGQDVAARRATEDDAGAPESV